jgi:hypothetical protein
MKGTVERRKEKNNKKKEERRETESGIGCAANSDLAKQARRTN